MELSLTAVERISVQQDGTDDTFLFVAWAFDSARRLMARQNITALKLL